MQTIQFHTKFTLFYPTMRSKDYESQFEGNHVREWKIIGVGSGWGARDMGTADGPKVLMERIPPYFQVMPKALTYWHHVPLNFSHSNCLPLSLLEAQIHGDHVLEVVTHLCVQAKIACLQGNPTRFGGDHSIAISGLGGGVKGALRGRRYGADLDRCSLRCP